MINLMLYKLGITYNKPKKFRGYEEFVINEPYICERAYIRPRETPTSTKIRYGHKDYMFVKADYPLVNLPRFLVLVKNNDVDYKKKVLDSFLYLDKVYKKEEILDHTKPIIGYVAKYNLEYLVENKTFISRKIWKLVTCNDKDKDKDDNADKDATVTYLNKKDTDPKFNFQKKFIPFIFATTKYNNFHLVNKKTLTCDLFPEVFAHKAGTALESYFSDTVIMRFFQNRYFLRTYRVRKGAFWVLIRLISKIMDRLNCIKLFFEKKNKLICVLKKILIWANILKLIIKKVYRMLKRSVYRRRLSMGKHFRKFIFSIPYQKVLNLKKLSKFFKLIRKTKKKDIFTFNGFDAGHIIAITIFCYFRSVFFVIFFKFIIRLHFVKQVQTLIHVKNFTIIKGHTVEVPAHLPKWFFENIVVIKRTLFNIRNIIKLRAQKVKKFKVLKKQLGLRKKAALFCKKKKKKYVLV